VLARYYLQQKVRHEMNVNYDEISFEKVRLVVNEHDYGICVAHWDTEDSTCYRTADNVYILAPDNYRERSIRSIDSSGVRTHIYLYKSSRD
jgi:hypothetical protein